MDIILTNLKRLNWVDVFFVILLIRIAYIATKTGFPIEASKLLGTISAIFLACHFYSKLSSLLGHNFNFYKYQMEFFNLIAFLLLAILGYLIFVLLRMAMGFLIKMEAVSLLNRWGALILCIFRGALFSSLLLLIMIIANNSYINKSIVESPLGSRLYKITPAVYSSVWDNIVSRFMSKQEFNKGINEIISPLQPSHKIGQTL